MSKRTLFLIFALTLINVTFLLMIFYHLQTSKVTQITTTPEKADTQTTLLLGTPIVATHSPNLISNYVLPVEISTGNNKVTAVQLELQYDPEILTNVNIIPGPFFRDAKVLLNQIDIKAGRVFYVLGINLTSPAVAGKGTVAYINFSSKIKTQKETAILFLPKTLVTASGISKSVLKQTTNGFFTIGNKSATSSASSNQ